MRKRSDVIIGIIYLMMFCALMFHGLRKHNHAHDKTAAQVTAGTGD